MFFLALAEQTAEKNKTRTHNKTEPLSVMRGMRVNFPVHFRLLLLRNLSLLFISTHSFILLQHGAELILPLPLPREKTSAS